MIRVTSLLLIGLPQGASSPNTRSIRAQKWYHRGACRVAWDSTIRAESHTLRTVPGARSYPCVASGTLGSIEGIAR